MNDNRIALTKKQALALASMTSGDNARANLQLVSFERGPKTDKMTATDGRVAVRMVVSPKDAKRTKKDQFVLRVAAKELVTAAKMLGRTTKSRFPRLLIGPDGGNISILIDHDDTTVTGDLSEIRLPDSGLQFPDIDTVFPDFEGREGEETVSVTAHLNPLFLSHALKVVHDIVGRDDYNAVCDVTVDTIPNRVVVVTAKHGEVVADALVMPVMA